MKSHSSAHSPRVSVLVRALLRTPADLPPGAYTLHLSTPAGSALVTPVTVMPSTRRYTLPPFGQPLDARFGDTIGLTGATTARSGDTLTVTLVWQALTAPASGLTVFVHLLGPDGAVVAQSDAVPAGGYATTEWAPGEVVIDSHQLSVPGTALPGRYRLVAGLYDPVTGQRMAVVDGSGNAYADQAVLLSVEEMP